MPDTGILQRKFNVLGHEVPLWIPLAGVGGIGLVWYLGQGAGSGGQPSAPDTSPTANGDLVNSLNALAAQEAAYQNQLPTAIKQAIQDALAQHPSTPAAPGTPTGTTPQPPAGSSFAYNIVRGDTLSGIARRYSVSISQILALNPQITNPNLIYAGTTIQIPRQPT